MNQQEIAAKLGISQSAVSLVLNNPQTRRVSATRRRQIISLLKSGHHLNHFSLKKTWNLGYVLDMQQDLHQVFFEKSLSGIEETAALNSYNVIVECYRGTPLQLLRRKKVDGLIVRSGPAWTDIRKQKDIPPVVLLNCSSPNLECDEVMPDNWGGMHKALAHLAALGCRRPAFIGASPEYSPYSCNYIERRQAFTVLCDTLGMNGMAASIPGPVTPDAAPHLNELLNTWCRNTAPPDALISVNHLYGAIAHSICPGLPIVACDNKIEMGYDIPDMLVLVQDLVFMGRTAAELLFRRLADPTAMRLRVTCDVCLQPSSPDSCQPAASLSIS